MKKIKIAIISILILMVTVDFVFSQRELDRIKGETGLWKSLRVPAETFADTLSLTKGADSTIVSSVFRTHAISSIALKVTGRADSIDIEKVRLYQWSEYRSPSLDDSNFVYISDMSWKSRTNYSGTAGITSYGTYACNIPTSDDPITCLWYSRFEFVLKGDHKVLSGIQAVVTVQTWDRP
jgi:hypothetical protein